MLVVDNVVSIIVLFDACFVGSSEHESTYDSTAAPQVRALYSSRRGERQRTSPEHSVHCLSTKCTYMVMKWPYPGVVEDHLEVLLQPPLCRHAHAPRQHGVLNQRRHVPGPARFSSPHHMMPYNSRDR